MPGTDREVPPLFEFLAVLAVALLRRKVTGPQAGIAILVALTSRGTSGERATVDEERLALESGLSTRQVWRHFSALRDAGWFDQTVRPTRGNSDGNGRRARYRLTPARLDLSHDLHLTSPSGGTSHDRAAGPESTDGLLGDRLTVSAESSDTPEREDVAVTPSGGSPAVGSTSTPNFNDVSSVRATPADGHAFAAGWPVAEECSQCLRREVDHLAAPSPATELGALTPTSEQERTDEHLARIRADLAASKARKVV